MALPLIPIAVAGASGIAGALTGGLLSKKDEHIEHHAAFENYSPQQLYAPTTSYAYTGSTYVIDSPAAYVSPSSDAQATSYPTQSMPTTTATGAVDWTTLGLVGIVAVAGVALLTAPKRRR
jgi:hypothetical protein